MTDTDIIVIAILYGLALLGYGIGAGLFFIVRNEMARRRAKLVEFPPTRTIGEHIGDDVPW